MSADGLTFLDGPLGSELERRGLALPAPMWSAVGVWQRPELLVEIHRDYAEAGAQVHTAATFRTTARALHDTEQAAGWCEVAGRAVALCRQAVGGDMRVAGSMAPLEDCFLPEATPDDEALAREHAELAECLARAGCDLLLVETMPTERELVAATRAARATGLPVWSAITLGPDGAFFDADSAAAVRDAAVQAGASAFLVNCTPPDRITSLLDSLPPADEVPLGAYGNDIFEGETGWNPARYAEEAARWRDLGATLLGGCCGTTTEHLVAMRERLCGTGHSG
jgi:S-methylmethionine-dependent homocysteine/selenocysteine methylase